MAFALWAALQDDRWVFIGSDNDFSSVEVDQQSIRRRDDTARIWERRMFHRNQGGMVREIEFDCRERTLTVFAINWQEADGSSNRKTFEAFERNPDSIDPESLDEKVFNAVCG